MDYLLWCQQLAVELNRSPSLKRRRIEDVVRMCLLEGICRQALAKTVYRTLISLYQLDGKEPKSLKYAF